MSTEGKPGLISRREFSSRLTTLGMGLASAGVFPSFSLLRGNTFPEGKFVDVHHHIGEDLLNGPVQFAFDPVLRWMDEHGVSQTVLLSAVEYPQSYYTGRGGTVRKQDKILEQIEATKGCLRGGRLPCPVAY
jgi:hypothetical protein